MMAKALLEAFLKTVKSNCVSQSQMINKEKRFAFNRSLSDALFCKMKRITVVMQPTDRTR